MLRLDGLVTRDHVPPVRDTPPELAAVRHVVAGGSSTERLAPGYFSRRSTPE
jgi:hypothetical protein